MTDVRLLVTGDIPRFAEQGPGGAPCDAVELVAAEVGMSWDNVMHLEQGDQQGLNRLQTMSQYVASVGLRDVVQAMPTATELLVFNTHPHWFGWRHHARRLGNVLTAAHRQGVPFHYFMHDQQFSEDYLSKLAASRLRSQ